MNPLKLNPLKLEPEANQKTQFICIDSVNPENDIELLTKAAKLLIKGGLVAFPTETVYGLGADASNYNAVQKIYEAKGRPNDNPLILHIADKEQVYDIAGFIPPAAQKLMDAFWPGPLTLVFKKSDKAPVAALAGLSTVGIRMPENRVAHALLKVAKIPIAAPSANSSGKPSPTRASHVLYDLDGKIDMIIDGGNAEHGLESTIVDVSENIPCLLRPGSITEDMLRQTIGKLEIDPAVFSKPDASIAPKAPGMKYTHYSPNADLQIVTGSVEQIISKTRELATASILQNPGKKIGILATEQTKNAYSDIPAIVLSLGDRNRPSEIGGNLFKYLRKVDYLGIDIVIAEGVDESELGLAIMNRLKKAAGYCITEVCK